jgi:hypothetical protein
LIGYGLSSGGRLKAAMFSRISRSNLFIESPLLTDVPAQWLLQLRETLQACNSLGMAQSYALINQEPALMGPMVAGAFGAASANFGREVESAGALPRDWVRIDPEGEGRGAVAKEARERDDVCAGSDME